MNKDVYRMLKTSGVWKTFLIMLILRSPFDILNSVLTANMMQSFIRMIENKVQQAVIVIKTLVNKVLSFFCSPSPI